MQERVFSFESDPIFSVGTDSSRNKHTCSLPGAGEVGGGGGGGSGGHPLEIISLWAVWVSEMWQG